MKVLIALATATALGLVFAAVRTLPKYRGRSEALRLHRRLSAANSLDDAESKWLWEIASSPDLPDPALVFLQPGLLDAAGGEAPDRAASVRQKLFGE